MSAYARRPYRRRRLVVFALVASLLIVVIDLAVRSLADGPDRRLAYLDEARPLIEDSSQQGLDLDELRTGATRLDRVRFDRRVARLRAETEATVALARELAAPASLRDADALLISTLSIRAQAADRLAAAFTTLLGGGTSAQAAGQLGAVARDVRLADRLYALFAASAARVDGGTTMPPSAWIADDPAWNDDALGRFVATLRTSGNLATVHDVAVVAVSVFPPPVITEGDEQVLATAEPLTVTIIAGNRGSVTEAEVRVVVKLTVPGQQPVTLEDVVELAAGAERTVRLGKLAPVAGKQATLEITVEPVAGEQASGDNRTVLRLRVRPPAPSTTTTTVSDGEPTSSTAPPAPTTTGGQ